MPSYLREETSHEKILGVHRSPHGHWVGDGFPVRSLFTYDNLARHISPFLLLDYAGPHDFTPTTARRGVGQHPHRGFETVTIVYRASWSIAIPPAPIAPGTCSG